MDKIFLFISYIIFSLVTIYLASLLIGIFNKEKRIFLISIIGGSADFLVKEILVPRFGLIDGLHLVTGIIILSVTCYYILDLGFSSAFFVSLLSYILGAITETIFYLIIINIWGKDVLVSLVKDSIMRPICALISLIPLIIPIIYFKFKKKSIY